ncbi:NADH-quinone oxidoreductase subunit A [Blochmannia endosymbiont of Camponotus (Colobopsis) obliquus]|nr:NADH-quinone oxidoreductase subunit A [Blochmannia endosymbiont of Camponotus (Colobopsis) obliquus]
MQSNWGWVIFFIGSISICLVMLFFGFLLGERSLQREDDTPFESGIASVGSARLNFSVQFYLISAIFVIFDAESLYLYAWSTVVREAGWLGFIESTVFIFVLFVSLIYLFNFGIFNWVRKHPLSCLGN